VPLGEPETHLLVHPVEKAAAGFVAVLGAATAVVAKRRAGERGAGEELVDVEDQPVILRPVPLVVDDAFGCRLGVPVREPEERVFDRVTGCGGKRRRKVKLGASRRRGESHRSKNISICNQVEHLRDPWLPIGKTAPSHG